MQIHLHISEHSVEFQTDARGDLHIYAKGLEPPPMPKRKRKSSPKGASVTPMAVPPHHGIPYTEPPPPAPAAEPATPAEKLNTLIMDDQGWQ